MMIHINHDSFVSFLLQISIATVLVCTNAFSDGIVLRNGMQMVVTIRDTSGDSISIQEGMWEAGIAKSLIASFWYNGRQYSYVNDDNAIRFPSSTISNPIKELKPQIVTIPGAHDSSAINQKLAEIVNNSSEEDLPLPPTSASVPEVTQSIDTVNLNAANSLSENAIDDKDTSMQADLDLGDYSSAAEKSAEMEPVPLFDPEYTNEELVKKKRVFNILLTAGCAMGATSTTIFLLNGNWDIKLLAVPFMIASIPLTTVGIKKSIEYSKRLKSAEYKKRRAQMSLSLQIQKADLLITF
jgi:hypothetical protein